MAETFGILNNSAVSTRWIRRPRIDLRDAFFHRNRQSFTGLVSTMPATLTAPSSLPLSPPPPQGRVPDWAVGELAAPLPPRIEPGEKIASPQVEPEALRDRGRAIRRSNLRASIADGATFGVMVGAGESYLAAFALAIGLGEISAGLVSSVPLLAGGILQLISLRAVHWFGSEKRWVVLCAALQGMSFVPLVYAALYGSLALVPLLVIASLYWSGGLASGPAWNTWMESIVPGRIRPRYFSLRTRISQSCTLVGLVGGGLTLHWADSQGHPLVGFACIFAAAGLFRMWSVSWLIRHHQDPAIRQPRESRHRTTLSPVFDGARTRVDGARTQGAAAAQPPRSPGITPIRLLTYLVAVQGMVQISGPYFSPYLLKQLHFSYSQFVTLLAIGFLSKVIALSWWTKLTHRGGATRLLWIGGIGIVPLSALWIISDNIYQLAMVQIVSGIMWAAYELGFFLMFFETLPIQQRTRMLTYYNLANMMALCAGAFVGAGLLQLLDGGQSAYWVLFGLSSIGRLLALALLFGAQLRSIPAVNVCLRVLGVRLSASMVDSPILGSLEDRPRD